MNKKRKTMALPEDLVLRTPDGKLFDVPAEGSLSLLALGYKGLMAWRAKRIAIARKTEGPASQ
jgi:hypothetical protein